MHSVLHTAPHSYSDFSPARSDSTSACVREGARTGSQVPSCNSPFHIHSRLRYHEHYLLSRLDSKKIELVENPKSTRGGDPPDPSSWSHTSSLWAGPRAYFLWERNMVKIKCKSSVKGISEYDRIADWSSLVDVLCLLMNPSQTNGATDQSI